MTYSETPAGHYLVLGSTGLVGCHALLRLKDEPGVRVRAIYHNRQPRVVGENIDHVRADLLDRDYCLKIMDGIDYVLMFAGILLTAPVIASNPLEPVMRNLTMTSQALEAAYYANVKRFLWLSSTTGYPAVNGTLKEDQMFDGDPPDPYYPIGWMTRYVETLCQMYSSKLPKQLSTIILRPTMIYGEYDDFKYETAHFLPALIRRVVERQDPIEIWGTGEQTRDVVHASDVIEASLCALARTDVSEAFNIASGMSHTVNEILAMILAIDNYEEADVTHVMTKPTTVFSRSFTNEKARDILGFSPRVSISDGLTRTIGWYRQTRALT